MGKLASFPMGPPWVLRRKSCEGVLTELAGVSAEFSLARLILCELRGVVSEFLRVDHNSPPKFSPGIAGLDVVLG